MSFHPTQPLLANGHQAQAPIEALKVRITVLETLLAESTVREMENAIKYRVDMEHLKQTYEAESTALRSTIAELLRELCFCTPRGSPADEARLSAEARVLCLIHQLTGAPHHLSRPVAVAGADQPEATGSKRRRTSGPERE